MAMEGIMEAVMEETKEATVGTEEAVRATQVRVATEKTGAVAAMGANRRKKW